MLEIGFSAVIAGGAVIGAVGASSPGKRLDDHEGRLRALEARGERLEAKLDDIHDLLKRRLK